ncbi:hypothetical protein [Flavobacterium sp. PL02]|uniref:hypothetical protein n=1 Tax=Flavobacterium sp. PL02 TaxID=3088354 RepID=UPI002B2313C7|nr:hypothetical protein [Flavobacterium sp. PL02]MEA9415881.1 hypothetical protein [Flavobacterium sp. PL02]
MSSTIRKDSIAGMKSNFQSISIYPDIAPKSAIPKDSKKQRRVVLSIILFLGEILLVKHFFDRSIK